LIGEIYLPIRQLVTYYGPTENGAHLPFNFQLITLPWEARQIAAVISVADQPGPARYPGRALMVARLLLSRTSRRCQPSRDTPRGV